MEHSNTIDTNASRNEVATEKLNKTIDNFYNQSGATGPVENLGELLTSFFTSLALDSEDENGEPEHNYKTYNPSYIHQVVLTTTETMSFIVRLKEDWDHYSNK